MFDNVVPLKDVPKRICIAEKTLRNWRCKGVHAHIFVKLGGKVFVNLDELNQIVADQVSEAKKQARRLGL